MRQTRAVVLPAAGGPVTVEQIRLREPEEGEVLLKIEACGVCHSDLFVAGLEKLPLAPVTLGHEGVGRVEAVGAEVHDWAPGDRAGITFLGTTCGTCEWCRTGRERFCPKQTNFGYSRHGVLSEFAVVPAAALVRVPAEIPAEQAAPMCCAGWTAYGALREAGLAESQTVALFGFGGLGHLALQMARVRRLRVAVADLSQRKLEMALEGGAEIAVAAENAGRTLQKEHGGVHAAIVMTASSVAIQQAFRALKRGGTLILVGLSVNSYELPLTDTILRGVTIRGSYLGTREDLEQVFKLARSGAIRAHVQQHELEETPAILDNLRRGEILGRAVARLH